MILLDTHAWIWCVTESVRLSGIAAQAIAQADSLGVHIISCWEVAMLVEKGRIGFKQDVAEWVDLALQRPKVNQKRPCRPLKRFPWRSRRSFSGCHLFSA